MHGGNDVVRGAVRMRPRAKNLRVRRYRARRRRRAAAGVVLLLAALCAGWYFWGGSKPLTVLLTGAQGRQKETGEVKTVTFTLPEGVWYVLEMGRYPSLREAEEAAVAYVNRGAAGYVRPEGTAGCVLAAAYPTRADAAAVQSNLKKKHGLDSTVAEAALPRVVMRMTGRTAQLNAVCDACDFLSGACGQLYQLSLRLDQGEMTVSEAQAQLASHQETARALARALESLPEDAPCRTLAAVLDGLTDALNGARERGITAAEAGGRIKYGQLTAIYGLKDGLDGLADR